MLTHPDAAVRAVAFTRFTIVLVAIALLATLASAVGAPARAQDLDDGIFGDLQRERIAIVDKLRPSVVAVSGRNTPIGGGQSMPVEGGSGFVISDQGHVLTSTLNVSNNSDEARVLFADGKSESAKVIARDALNACVVLKVEGEREFVPVEFGKSTEAVAGQMCMSLGNPWSSMINDFEVAASNGTVSGMYRPSVPRNGSNQRRFIGDYRGMILESTCAINDGSWGGPLVDREGKVIAMVAKVVSYNSWLGGAVPIHQIELVLDLLMEGKPNPGSWHGLTLTDSTDAEQTGMVVIDDIDRSSPGRDAKLRDDDVIMKIDGEKLTNGVAQANALFAEMPAGTTVELMIQRKNKRMIIAMTLALNQN